MAEKISPQLKAFLCDFGGLKLDEKFSTEALNNIFNYYQEVMSWSKYELANRGLTDAFNYCRDGKISWEDFFSGVTETSYRSAYAKNKEQVCILAVDLAQIAKEFIDDDGITELIDNSAAQRFLAKHHSNLVTNNAYLAKAINTLVDNDYFFDSNHNDPDCEYSTEYIYLKESLLDLGI